MKRARRRSASVASDVSFSDTEDYTNPRGGGAEKQGHAPGNSDRNKAELR